MAHGKDKKMIYELIKRYVQELKSRRIDIVAAYLYGSHADATAGEWSDIDVALLTNTFQGDSFDFKFLLM